MPQLTARCWLAQNSRQIQHRQHQLLLSQCQVEAKEAGHDGSPVQPADQLQLKHEQDEVSHGVASGPAAYFRSRGGAVSFAPGDLVSTTSPRETASSRLCGISLPAAGVAGAAQIASAHVAGTQKAAAGGGGGRGELQAAGAADIAADTAADAVVEAARAHLRVVGKASEDQLQKAVGKVAGNRSGRTAAAAAGEAPAAGAGRAAGTGLHRGVRAEIAGDQHAKPAAVAEEVLGTATGAKAEVAGAAGAVQAGIATTALGAATEENRSRAAGAEAPAGTAEPVVTEGDPRNTTYDTDKDSSRSNEPKKSHQNAHSKMHQHQKQQRQKGPKLQRNMSQCDELMSRITAYFEENQPAVATAAGQGLSGATALAGVSMRGYPVYVCSGLTPADTFAFTKLPRPL